MQGLTDRLSEDLQELWVQELEYAKAFRDIITAAMNSNVTTLRGPAGTFIADILIQRAKSSASLDIAQAFTSLFDIFAQYPCVWARQNYTLVRLSWIRLKDADQDPRFASLGCVQRIESSTSR